MTVQTQTLVKTAAYTPDATELRKARSSQKKHSVTKPVPSSGKSTAVNSPSQGAHAPHHHCEPNPPIITALTTYFSYGLLIFFGHFRDLLDRLFARSKKDNKAGYAPVVSDFEDFYTRRLYHRIQDCWNRPIVSCPGAVMDIAEREFKYMKQRPTETGVIRSCLNLGSYNYLGFGDYDSPTKQGVFEALNKFSTSSTSTRSALGTTTLHADLERVVAKFVGKEDAMIFGMGFGTNSTSIPTLVGKGGLIISDSMNHASIAIGCRSSGAVIRVFRHNDIAHLEEIIRKAIIEGQPLTHRPWTKILIAVEGIYSMEGETCLLPQIVEIKNKYKCYLFVDEAHSIGAIGPNGRGICDKTNVSPSEVDILMGTFTKSFGAVGGYIAASKEIIDFMKRTSAGSVYSCSISPPACQQIISALNIISGDMCPGLGEQKLRALRENSDYFRRRLVELGCHILGDYGSPVVPLMLYNPAKIVSFSRECLAHGLGVVVVGFPATPLLLSRTRFCVSAAHTKEQLDAAITHIDQICTKLGLKYARPLHKSLLGI